MLRVAPGSRVFLHQAFRCCPYAGAVTSQTHDYLEANGFVVVPDAESADVHVVNTCGSDARQAQLTWDVLGRLSSSTPAKPVVATGWLVSIDPRRLAAELAPFAQSARFDPRHLPGLDTVFGAERIRFDDVQPALHNEYAGNDLSAGWYHILASTGCLGTCSFCAIRRATGRPKSRPVDHVLTDLRRGVAEGLHDILLVSTDLSAWGTDFGQSVVDLVRAVSNEPGEFRLAAESIEPTLFLEHFDALLPHFTNGRWAFLGLPIQSGSARILRQMERTYDPRDVVAAVRRLKVAAPDLVMRTDLIYGFGDETDKEFHDSIEVSRSFDLPSFNAYQPRPGTAPLRLAPDVLKTRRDRCLAELHARAQAGLLPIRRWDGGADTPRLAASAGGGSGALGAVEERGPAEPWETAEGQAWLTQTARRFQRVLSRQKSIVLSDGWVLGSVRVTAEAVVLGLRHADGRTLDLGLRHAGWPGVALARGDRFAVWVMAKGIEADAGLDGAIKRLLAGLGVG